MVFIKASCLVLFLLAFNGENLWGSKALIHPVPPEQSSSSLVLLHVLFRHGNRTADQHELYPKDPYRNFTYYPFGNGQLTNAGKKKEYSIGQALRRKYDRFLGKYYTPEILDVWTTDYNRTKMSLELVLASLFPPKRVEVWNWALSWQPIPYNYLPRTKDKVLYGLNCPRFLQLQKDYVCSAKNQANIKPYAADFKYIAENTGLPVEGFEDVYNLYFGLATEEEWGFHLPKWTQPVWPDKIIQMSIQQYFVTMANTEMQQIATGYFLKKVIDDTQSKIEDLPDENGIKMHLYSAHENNIAQLLVGLNVFKPHIPTYGSYVVLEVHKINGTYGIKIFYENYTTKTPQLLKLPACEEFCPLDKFISITEELIPADDLCNTQ